MPRIGCRVGGGGNSAGQAAVYLSQNGRKVFLLIRGDDLCKSMSAYLAHWIMNTPNIEVLRNTSVVGMSGDGYLSSIDIPSNQTGEKRTIKTAALFSFIGATPRTDWLPAEIEKDAKNFVRTGITLTESPHWAALSPFTARSRTLRIYPLANPFGVGVGQPARRSLAEEGSCTSF